MSKQTDKDKDGPDNQPQALINTSYILHFSPPADTFTLFGAPILKA